MTSYREFVEEFGRDSLGRLDPALVAVDVGLLRVHARDRAAAWAGALLPRWLVRQALIRAGAHASVTRHPHERLADITLLDTLDAWCEPRR